VRGFKPIEMIPIRSYTCNRTESFNPTDVVTGPYSHLSIPRNPSPQPLPGGKGAAPNSL